MERRGEGHHHHPHIAVLPSPGMGHLIPLLQFAKRFISIHTHFTATIILPTHAPLSKSQLSFLHALPSPAIDYILLPPVNLDDLPPHTKAESQLSITVARSIPSLRLAFRSLLLSKNLVALVVDLFGTDAFDVANEFKVSPNIFFPTTAMVLSLFLGLPKLDEAESCEYRDLPHLIHLPGCVPIHGKDLLDPLQDRTNDAYKWVLHNAKRYRMAEGIMVNSFMDLEEKTIQALIEAADAPPVYPVGPVIQMDATGVADGAECLRWLDDQPCGSVLFISFGSGGTLSQTQIDELAWGLELSEQRFIWVVRSPNNEAANASFFNAESLKNPCDFLPAGFLERTKGNGVVVPSWAPQAQILQHESTGGFVTHCGWNSILEAVVNGVPFISWPLYAEQKMNAVLLNEGLRVALRPQSDEDGVVNRAEIAKLLKSLMEGEEGKRLRSRMRDLKHGAAKALGHHGSSTISMAQVAANWTTK